MSLSLSSFTLNETGSTMLYFGGVGEDEDVERLEGGMEIRIIHMSHSKESQYFFSDLHSYLL